MNPVEFKESNIKFSPPADLVECQCSTIHAYVDSIKGGSVDGSQLVITCWQPTPSEIEDIVKGMPIFFSSTGGLPPHFLSTSFEQATHPA